MAKYTPLTEFLARVQTEEVAMTFAEIERLLGAPLPASKRHAAWWSNNEHNNVMTRAWRTAGFRTEKVDVAGERLVFRRSERPEPSSATDDPEGFVSRFQARFGGAFILPPDLDLTAPTGEIWDAETA